MESHTEIGLVCNEIIRPDNIASICEAVSKAFVTGSRLTIVIEALGRVQNRISVRRFSKERLREFLRELSLALPDVRIRVEIRKAELNMTVLRNMGKVSVWLSAPKSRD